MSFNRTPSGPSPDEGPDEGASGQPPGLAARRVLRAVDRATLATSMRPDGMNADSGDGGGGDRAGWAYPSLVLTALDHDATPLLLLSTLALHTANIAADGRIGLLFDGTRGLAQPLAGPRVSVLGRAAVSDEPRHRARFRARHPGAALYMDFADFAVYRVAVERAHFVAGFGRVQWIETPDLLLDALPGGAVPAFAAVEAGVADEMGEGAWPGGWTLTGIDPEGADLRRNGAIARRTFARPVGDIAAARAALAILRQEWRGGENEDRSP